MIVLLIAIVAFVAFRDTFRADPEMEVESFDYLASVEAAQGAGFPVVYPPALAAGWQATPGGFGRGDVPEFSLNFLTDDEEYVGIKVVADGAGAVLTRVLGENYDAGEEREVANSDDVLGGRWDSYREGGDVAIVRDLPADAAAISGATSAPEPTEAPADPPADQSTDPDAAGSGYVLIVFGAVGVDDLIDFAENLSLAPLAD